MKKKLKNHTNVIARGFLCLLVFSIISISGFSQNAGISPGGAVVTDPAAGLDVNFANKGLLTPRVALVSLTSTMPLAATTLAAGMIVYSPASNLNVSPGLYIYDGTKWVSVLPKATANGEMQYWNGANWVAITPGITGQRLKVNASGVPVWAP